ncbi:MAG: type II toxin-antitoxin system HicB family antitoxin [Gemmatimonadetes bacterium]|nr:type II toxin-antitoxin system HicB family antitoxin [Gemmatimonadota bacterium]
MTLHDYLALPWTVHGRAMRDEADGSLYYLFTIEELPGFSAVGDTRAEAESELGDALETYLAASLENGGIPRLPALVAGRLPQARSAA